MKHNSNLFFDKRLLKKRLFSVLVFVLVSAMLMQTAFGASILSYTYRTYGNDVFPIQSPPPYNYVGSIYAADVGLPADGFSNITCIFSTDEYFFIGAGGALVITDHDFETQEIITSVLIDGEEQALTTVDDIFVTPEGEVYFCESNKNRIIHLNADWTFNRELGRPEGMLMTAENVAYNPMKCVVDRFNRIYVIAKNVYEGMIEINPDGTFSRYFGVNRVRYSPADLFWRQFQTEAQRARSSLWLPTEFSHMAVDAYGFIFTTVVESRSATPIRKLNANGIDILRYPGTAEDGTKYRPVGDMVWNERATNVPAGMSQLTAIDVNSFGLYVVLDSKRSRLFVYDEDGYMLYAMGEQGSTEGKFQLPWAVRFMGDDKLVVVDRQNYSLEVFRLNEYGEAIHQAAYYQHMNDYMRAADEWRKVLSYNANYQYAYTGIGKALYRQGYHNEAMEYFLNGADKTYYSMAFDKAQQEFMDNYFGYISLALLVIAVFAVALAVRRKLKANKNGEGGMA